MKDYMFEYFSANNQRQSVDVVDLLVDQYNNAIRSTIKMIPLVVRKTKIKCGEIYIQN